MSIRKVKVLEGEAKVNAVKMKLDPEDLVLVQNDGSLEVIEGDPISWLVNRAKEKVY